MAYLQEFYTVRILMHSVFMHGLVVVHAAQSLLVGMWQHPRLLQPSNC